MKKAMLVTALWCPSCLLMRPRYQYVLNYYGIDYEELDFDMDSEKYAPYQIGDTIPIFILLEDQQEVLRIIGEKSMADLMKMIKDV